MIGLFRKSRMRLASCILLKEALLLEVYGQENYNGTMEYLVLLALALFIFFMLRFIVGSDRSEKKASLKKADDEARRKATERAGAMGLLVSCPLCSSPLAKGEDIVSKVYRPMNVPDQLCTINGCPHCYPRPEAGVKRVCPVCGRDVPLKDGHLIARLFNYADGKKHVVVTGCTECSKGSK